MKIIYNSAEEVRKNISTDKTIIFVGGCFDLLHIAHIHLLENAASLGDILVVGVLSDTYIKSYKSLKRPIIQQKYRAETVAALRCVNYVLLCEESTSDDKILSVLNPSIIVFGKESKYSEKIVIREKRINKNFPHIHIVYQERFNDESVSTSGIIERILQSEK